MAVGNPMPLHNSFSLADDWFYVAGSACFWCKIVDFKRKNEKKCMGIVISIKNCHLGREIIALLSQITLYGFVDTSP